MKKAILFISLSFLLFITACQSAESKEVMEYHNGFVEEIVSGVELITEAYDEMDAAATDEEAIEIGNNKILPTLEKMKTHMDAQNPEKEDTKDYHKIRSEWFGLYEDIVTTEVQSLDDYINERITDEDLDTIFEEVFEKSLRAEELAVEAEEKVDELADKYKFEILDEE